MTSRRPITQQQLAAIVLRAFQNAIRGADVREDDDFFELGGDSVDALRLVGELRAATGAGLRMVDLVRSPTPASLAALLSVRLAAM